MVNFSDNMMMMAGLRMLGEGLQGRSGFGAGAQGLMQGYGMDQAQAQMDMAKAADERSQGLYDMQMAQHDAWQNQVIPALMQGYGGAQPQPQPVAPAPQGDMMAQTPAVPSSQALRQQFGLMSPVGGAGSAAVNPTRAPGSSPAATGSTSGRGYLASLLQENPSLAPILAAMGPQQGGAALLNMAMQRPTQRATAKDANGYLRYMDTGERVFPDAQAQPDLPTGMRPGPDGKPEWIPGYLEGRGRVAREGATQITNDLGRQGLTPAQEAIDKKFAENYVDFQLGGGYADAEKNLEQIEGAIAAIEGEGEVTGTLTARLPDSIRAFVDPEGLNVQQLVEEVVQRNLREVLGAQFTEREGERLISRAYDARLDEATNLERLRRLAGAMRSGLEARRAAAQYYEDTGTMRGYQGPQLPTGRSLERAMDAPGQPRDSGDAAEMSDEALKKSLGIE